MHVSWLDRDELRWKEFDSPDDADGAPGRRHRHWMVPIHQHGSGDQLGNYIQVWATEDELIRMARNLLYVLGTKHLVVHGEHRSSDDVKRLVEAALDSLGLLPEEVDRTKQYPQNLRRNQFWGYFVS